MSAIVIYENDGSVTYTLGPTLPGSALPIDFPYFFADEIKVYRVTFTADPFDTDPEILLDAGIDYTLAGVSADDGFSAGAVTLLAPGFVPNCRIRIDRAMRTDKAHNFPEMGAISIPGMNTLFSRLFSLIQDLRRAIAIIEGRLDTIDVEIDIINSAIADIRSDIADLVSRVGTIEGQIIDIYAKLASLQSQIDVLRQDIAGLSPLTVDIYAIHYGLSESNTPQGNVAAINAAIVEGALRRTRTIVNRGAYDIAGQINPVSGSHLVFEPNTVLRPVAWSTNGTVIGNLQPVDNVVVEGITMDFSGYPVSPYGIARQGIFTQEATATGVSLTARVAPLTGAIMTIAGTITGTLKVGQAIYGIGVDLARQSYIAAITVNPSTGLTEYFIPSTQTVAGPISIRAFGCLVQLAADDPITAAQTTNPSRLIYMAGGTSKNIQARGILEVDETTKTVRVNSSWGDPGPALPGTILVNTATLPANATFTAASAPDLVNHPTYITITGTTGTLYARSRITGGGVDPNVLVFLSQFISGTPGGNGVWRTSSQIALGGGTITANPTSLFDVGMVLHGEGVLEETRITAIVGNTLTIDKNQIVAAPVTMRCIEVPADTPSAFTPTRYQWGWNDNVISFGGGASNIRIMRTLGYNMRGDQFQGAGGKIVNFEQGVINGQIIDTVGIGDPAFPPVACVFVQGLSDVSTTGRDRSATEIIIDRVDAHNFAAALMIGSADTSEELPGNPEELLVIASNITFRNCGHAPLRMVGAGSYQQKSGAICLFRNQNTILTNIDGYNSPDYPDTFPGYPTDFPERVGFGLRGPIGAVIWGYARNTYVGNISYFGSADALVQINRARAMGEDAGPSGRPENVFDFKIENLRHYNGNISHVLAIDRYPVGRVTNTDMKISLRCELSQTTTMNANSTIPIVPISPLPPYVTTPLLMAPELAGYTGSTIDITNAATQTRIIGTPAQIIAGGNTIASFPAGATQINSNQSIAGYLRVGSTVTPTNATAGDITGQRLSLGNVSALTGQVVRIETPLPLGSSGFGLVVTPPIQATSGANISLVHPQMLLGEGNYTSALIAGVRSVHAGATSHGLGASTTTAVGFYADNSNVRGTNNLGVFTNLPATLDNNAGTTATILSYSIAGGVVTITTTAAHTFVAGQLVTIAPAALNAGSFVIGASYFITAVGTTDFTLIGATSNTVNVRFVATGAGTGTGTATPAIGGSGLAIVAATTPTFTYNRVLPDTAGSAVGGTVTAAKNWQYGNQGTAPSYTVSAWKFGGAANTVPTALVDITGTTTVMAPLRIRHGSVPATPNDGDMWTTTAGVFIRINGVTKTFTTT